MEEINQVRHDLGNWKIVFGLKPISGQRYTVESASTNMASPTMCSRPSTWRTCNSILGTMQGAHLNWRLAGRT